MGIYTYKRLTSLVMRVVRLTLEDLLKDSQTAVNNNAAKVARTTVSINVFKKLDRNGCPPGW